MTYKETLDYLYSRLPMFQRIGPAAYKADLSNTIELCKVLGDPEKDFRTVHIAGTNGKGSVSHLLASVFQSAGYKTGLYTSPHLKDFRERIRINGKMIPQKDVVKFVESHKEDLSKIDLSFFEWTVGLAFDHFSRHKVDIAIIETGLGGRLDSTNVIEPDLSVITNISYDHMNLLGNTLKKIAGEKAGIIKKNVPVVIGETQEETSAVFLSGANKQKSPIHFADKEIQLRSWKDTTSRTPMVRCVYQSKSTGTKYELMSTLRGSYQRKNFATVLCALEKLQDIGWNITEEHIAEGFRKVTEQTGLQGRWQILSKTPLIIADTGHNEGGIKEIVQQLRKTPHKHLHMVLGVVNDKDPGRILNLLPKKAKYYFCSFQLPRAMKSDDLREIASKYGLAGESFKTVRLALKEAKNQASKNDLIFVGGSTFVVAEAL